MFAFDRSLHYNLSTMRKLAVPLILLLLFAVSADRISLADSKEKPKLSIDGHPRQGFTPLNVAFHVTLTGVAVDDPEYYCLKEEWDFGDDSKSTETPNCEPYTAGTQVKSEFFAEHVFDEAGSYGVRLILGEGNKKLQTRKFTVAVQEKDY